ncbi:hypothetical protein WN944_001614 [Citrus x changshan-huyou]|uniref:Uncharacterized protein n=1 Tax=Citrus x changshan-huyou TaxID=2935761 RepID=A0AAP0MF18_9ROSI
MGLNMLRVYKMGYPDIFLSENSLLRQQMIRRLQNAAKDLVAIDISRPSTYFVQLEEYLGQQKVLENGYKMKVIKVEHEAHGVDNP